MHSPEEIPSVRRRRKRIDTDVFEFVENPDTCRGEPGSSRLNCETADSEDKFRFV